MSAIKLFPSRDLGPKDWGDELLIGHADGLYTLKRLTYRAGARGPLQYHERKDETFYLHSGLARVVYVGAALKLVSALMEPGQSYHIPPGAVHQFIALNDCVVFEASNPVFDDRVNVEHLYE